MHYNLPHYRIAENKLILYALRGISLYIPVPVKVITSISIFNQKQNILLGIFENN